MEYKKLGDIATYVNGYAFKPEDRGEEGLPIIRIQDLTGNSYDLGFYDGEYPIYGSGGIIGYADDYICNADTVIIGRKGSINNPIYS